METGSSEGAGQGRAGAGGEAGQGVGEGRQGRVVGAAHACSLKQWLCGMCAACVKHATPLLPLKHCLSISPSLSWCSLLSPAHLSWLLSPLSSPLRRTSSFSGGSSNSLINPPLKLMQMEMPVPPAYAKTPLPGGGGLLEEEGLAGSLLPAPLQGCPTICLPSLLLAHACLAGA